MTPADDNGPDPGSDEFVAAEYVLGVLPADERQAAAARIESDPAFARLVDAWESRLSPMASGYEPVEPPAELKQALDRRLFTGAAPIASTEPRAGIWHSLTFWRGLTALATAAFVIAVAVFLMRPPVEQPATQQLVASVSPKDSDVQYLAVYNPATEQLGLSHVTGERPQGKDFELWVIVSQNAPVSLGVIPEGQSVHLPVGPETRGDLEAGATFAISVEPQGGAPEGKPTGPIVAAGGLNAI